MDDFRLIADELATDIAAGKLRPGQQLPPQRQFARQRRIATSTAARVYGELRRRGLTTGEVGRGTFIRAASPKPSPALTEPAPVHVDLELNFPIVAGQADQLAASLRSMLEPEVLAAGLQPVGAAGTPAIREAAAALLSRAGWQPDPARLFFTGNGRQAIASAIAALVPAGERLGVEALTYPVVKGIAARLGVTLVPIATDEHGLVPQALADAGSLRAVYLQPALHNPLGRTMTGQRRADIAETLRQHELYAIEDAIYGFLREDLPPLAALAPEQTIVVDSLSKRLSPGLTLGFVVTPGKLADRVSSAIRSGTWAAPRFALDAATACISDGTATAIAAAKRRDAKARQRLAAQRLAGCAIHSDPHAYHCWWELPRQWRAETFVAAAARRGIAITPAAAFTIGSAHAPNAVRLALAAPPLDTLATALDTLAALSRAAPEDAGWE